MKNGLKRVFGILSALLIAGCSSSPNVALNKQFWTQNTQQPVLVALAQPPKAKLDLSGPRTLIGRVSSKTSTLKFSHYLKKFSVADLYRFQSQFVQKLEANNISAKRYAGLIPTSKLQDFDGDEETYAKLDYKPLAIRLGNNRLLLLSINKFGAKRDYVVVVPTSNPIAFCDAEGQLIDLKTNKILWRYSVSKEKTSGDGWDKGSSYQGFTQTLNQVIDEAMNAVMADFFSHAPIKK